MLKIRAKGVADDEEGDKPCGRLIQGRHNGTFDDFDLELRHYFLDCLAELRTLIAGIAEQLHQEGKHAKQSRQY
jgi:hypothetical protein